MQDQCFFAVLEAGFFAAGLEDLATGRFAGLILACDCGCGFLAGACLGTFLAGGLAAAFTGSFAGGFAGGLEAGLTVDAAEGAATGLAFADGAGSDFAGTAFAGAEIAAALADPDLLTGASLASGVGTSDRSLCGRRCFFSLYRSLLLPLLCYRGGLLPSGAGGFLFVFRIFFFVGLLFVAQLGC